jgi:4-azaleucine resistance transporter AzlC
MPAAARAAGVASAVWNPVEGGVLERVAGHPLPRPAAGALGRQRRAHLVDRGESREVGPHRLVGPHQRVLVRIDQTRDERESAPVDRLRPRVAGRSHRRVVPDGDDRAAAPGNRGRPGPCRIERPDPRSEHGHIGGAAHGGERTGHDAPVATTTTKDVWRAALIFTATSALIGLSFGVLARTSGISLVMTCAMSLLVFAGGAQFLTIATIASGGTPLAAVLGGVVLNARHLPYGLAVAPFLRGPLWKRALSSQVVLDESTALALAQPTPELGRLAFYACGSLLFVAWNLGTLVGALAGGAIADPSALGLDAAFPASMLALLAPLLRHRDVRAAALAGAAIALAVTPFTAPGVPILAAAAGVLAARLVPVEQPE